MNMKKFSISLAKCFCLLVFRCLHSWVFKIYSPLNSGRLHGGQVEAESLSRSNQLDEMREKLESRKLVMGNTSMHVKAIEGNVKREEERLSNEIRSLLVAGTALSGASKRLQVTLHIYVSQPQNVGYLVVHKKHLTRSCWLCCTQRYRCWLIRS